MKMLLVGLLAAACGGCALNGLDIRRMEGEGVLRVEPSEVAGHDFRVTVRNAVGIGFDGDRAEDRRKLAELALAAQCKKPVLLDERAVQRGTYLTGRAQVDFVARFRCLTS